MATDPNSQKNLISNPNQYQCQQQTSILRLHTHTHTHTLAPADTHLIDHHIANSCQSLATNPNTHPDFIPQPNLIPILTNAVANTKPLSCAYTHAHTHTHTDTPHRSSHSGPPRPSHWPQCARAQPAPPTPSRLG